MLGHLLSRLAPDLTYVRRPSYTKVVTTENFLTLELSAQRVIDVPIYVIVGFMQRCEFNPQQRNKDIIYRPTLVMRKVL